MSFELFLICISLAGIALICSTENPGSETNKERNHSGYIAALVVGR